MKIRYLTAVCMVLMLPLTAYTQTAEDSARLQTENEQLQQELKLLKQDRDNLQAQSSFLLKYKNQVVQAEQSLAAIEAERARWQSEREALKANNQKLEEELDSMRGQLVDLQTDALQLEEEKEEVRRRLAESRAGHILIDDLKNTIKENKREKARLEKRLRKQERAFHKAEEDTIKRDATIEVLRGHIKEMKQKYKSALAQNKVLEKKLNKQPKQYAEVARENKVLLKRTALMHYNLGVFYTQNKEYPRAVAEFEKAVELNPEDANTYFNLGYIYAEFYEDRSKAITNFERYLRLAKADDKDVDWVKKYLLTWQTWEGKAALK